MVGRIDIRLVPAALAAWLVTAAGIRWPVGLPTAALAVVVGAAAGALWFAASRTRRGGWRLLATNLVAIAAVGTGFGWAVAVRHEAADRHPITARFGTVAPVTVTPSESALPVGARRLMFRATLRRLGDQQMSGRVVVFASNVDFTDVVVGESLRFPARIARPTRHDLSVAALTAAGEPARRRANATWRTAHAVRARFAAAATRVLPADQARVLPALVLGDTSAVTVGTDREFRAAGLTHLMAVSGANVTIVCGAVLFSARLIGPRPAAMVAGITLVGFVIVVQPTASVLRAAVMGAIALLGVVSARRRQAIPSLSASVLVLLAVAPQLAVDVGFALSVVATAALVLVAPVWSARLTARGWPKPLADAVCVAWAAQLVTAPLIAGISGRVSLVSVLANLAVSMLVAPITVLGSAAAALGGLWPAGAEVLIRFTGPELWWLVHVARWAAGAPAATVPVPAATVPVPAGTVGVVGVAAVAVLIVVSWRWRWCRGVVAVSAACLLAWSLAEVLTGCAAVGVGGA